MLTTWSKREQLLAGHKIRNKKKCCVDIFAIQDVCTFSEQRVISNKAKA